VSDSYYIQRGQKTIGPFTTAKIQEAIRANKITSEDRVSLHRDGPWASLGLLQPDWFSSDASFYSSNGASRSLAWQEGRKFATSPATIMSYSILGVFGCSLLLYWGVTISDRLHILDSSIGNVSSAIHRSSEEIEKSMSRLEESLSGESVEFVHERVVWKNLSDIIHKRSRIQELRLVSCQRTGDSLTGRAVYDLIWAGKRYSESIKAIRDEQRELEEKAEKMIEEALGR